MTAEEARQGLRDWSTRRQSVADNRDPAVQAAVLAGLSDVEIRELTGLSRMTITKIRRSSCESERRTSCRCLDPRYRDGQPPPDASSDEAT